MRGYEIKLTADDNGSLQSTWLVTCPSLPEVATFGEDKADALRRGLLSTEEAIACRMADWDEVPEPVEKGGLPAFVGLSAQVLMKVMLYRALREQGISRAELQRRLGWHREQVERLFRIGHASRLDQMEAAFAAIGFGVNVSLEPSLTDPWRVSAA